MEPKKNPKYDIHRKRGVLLNVGLIVSLILVITAFNWKVPFISDKHYFSKSLAEAQFIDDPRITDFKRNDLPKPQPVKPTVIFPTDFKESIDATDNNEPTIRPDQGAEPVDMSFGTIDIPIETLPPDTFRVVEIMPEPIGGWPAFYKTLSKNIKYPRHATRVGATGKVFVEFTVNDQGKLSNFKIIKGIGFGCDEEATRILALTKWNPGKQRGKPVNVKMVQPVIFALTNY